MGVVNGVDAARRVLPPMASLTAPTGRWFGSIKCSGILWYMTILSTRK